MIAALYIDPRGSYSGLADVDCWDEKRDARLYAGPWPVVAHPPCSRWCRLAGLVEARWGHRRGDDGGCFASALAAVRRWGGVLEHPAYSDAWDAFGLPNPPTGGGWVRGFCGGWSCYVEQGRYGHAAKKATWLYAYGVTPPPMRWGHVPDRDVRALVSWCGNRVRSGESSRAWARRRRARRRRNFAMRLSPSRRAFRSSASASGLGVQHERGGSAMTRTESGAGWTMHLGDCLDVLPTIGAVDALVADPPYSSGGFTRGDRTEDPKKKYRVHDAKGEIATFTGDNRDQRSYLAWSALWLRHVSRVLRKGAPACVWTDWRQLPITTDALQAGGYVWRGIAVWTKANTSRPQMGRFRSDAEFLVWGSLGPMPARTEVGVLAGAWDCPPVNAANRLHLTEKPVEIMERAVLIAPPLGVVLDPFAGSGSTGVACLRTGRRFVGIELDASNFDLACERLRAEERGLTLAAARSGQLSIEDAIRQRA